MLKYIVNKIMGSQNERVLRSLKPLVAAINGREPEMQALSDAQLAAKTVEFRARIARTLEAQGHDGADKERQKKIREQTLEEVLPEVFAVVREVSRRTIGLRHFDVQMIGGIVLHRGGIAEMATGEGKTLVATLPVYLNALLGRGVHVVTVNDYLARRDREWMGPIYEFLNLTVGVIQHDMMPEDKQHAYACDITYGTNNEFGFDYLRDNMVADKRQCVQRDLHYAIVDEVDSILIDEARTPLIISGPTDDSVDKYYAINRIIPQLKRRVILEKDEIDAKYKGIDLAEGYDAVVDEKNHTVNLTEAGISKCEQLLGVASLYDDLSGEWAHHVTQAIKAHDLFERDVDYVVKDGKVVIVDEFTGRLMPGRRWSDGMHQAVEAKEKMRIERENQTLATVTLQNYFRIYEKLAGMTGTAFTEANEFKQIYKLDVVVIPTNRPLQRANHADSIYKSVPGKFKAVVEDIKENHAKGRPVLVGTISIEKSEMLSGMLTRVGVTHNVLNAKYHEREAHIVAQAGRYKAVTIATNMAGRGTDIVLGGNPEYMARQILAARKIDTDHPDHRAELEKILPQLKEEARVEHDKVVAAGGLHVIGTERHEARRIDNQLRGRSGRQGDPGSSRFYVSLSDDLMRLFGSERMVAMMERFGFEEDMVIEHPWISGQIERAQRRVEEYNFEIRKHLLEYDDVMNKQREIVYAQRRTILEGEDLKGYLFEVLAEVVGEVVDRSCPPALSAEEWDWLGLEGWVRQKLGPAFPYDKEKIAQMSHDEVREYLEQAARVFYEAKEASLGADHARRLERMVMLHVIDSRWKDHLYAMDSLREGVRLRAYGGRDPLIEYQREAYDTFADMMARIKEETVELLFRVQIIEKGPIRSVFGSVPQQADHKEFSGLSREAAMQRQRRQEENPEGEGGEEAAPKAAPVRHDGPKVGRNDPCPCGSGKKYKKCHGQ
ncbi:MAG: preprotein translocase subunit SecA [Deltaproteobacteria bacterium]